MSRSVRSPAGWVAVAALLVAVAAGCAGSTGAPRASDFQISVTERDFKITAPTVAEAGTVDFHVENHGPDSHEFLIARMTSGHLPLRSDGLTVNEEGLQRQIVGSLEPAAPNSVRDLDVQLKPGHYVLFCNMSGHFMGGMHLNLTVK